MSSFLKTSLFCEKDNKMAKFETGFRVMYADTDQMGVMHHGSYVKYLEVARTELMRSCGMPYKEMEKAGVMSPILDLNIKYIKPALYDEVLTTKTWVSKIKGSRIVFDYAIYREDTLLTKASTTLVFLDAKTMRPSDIKDSFIDTIQAYIHLEAE